MSDLIVYAIAPLSAIVCIIAAIYVLREYLWMRAYNHGFVCAFRNPNDDADFSWRAQHFYRSNRNRRAFILGARHAKGY